MCCYHWFKPSICQNNKIKTFGNSLKFHKNHWQINSVDESFNVIDNVPLSWKFQICTSPISLLLNSLGHHFGLEQIIISLYIKICTLDLHLSHCHKTTNLSDLYSRLIALLQQSLEISSNSGWDVRNIKDSVRYSMHFARWWAQTINIPGWDLILDKNEHLFFKIVDFKPNNCQ